MEGDATRHNTPPISGSCGTDCRYVVGADGKMVDYAPSEVAEQNEKAKEVFVWVWTGSSLVAGVVGADVIFDATELAYCTATGDVACATIAGIALTAPVVSASTLRRVGGTILEEGIQAASKLCSFSEDTLVMTEEGLVPISEVDVGEMVLAFNEATGEIGYYPVTATWAHLDPIIVELTIDGEVVWTTPEYPFYTADGNWEAVLELQVGEEIQQADGRTGVVEGVVYHTRPQMMYNMTVATAHTYFVGDGHWLVHNACPTGLRDASIGLQNLFQNESIRNRSIISIRDQLSSNGFIQTLSDNKQGYLFVNDLGEEVRIMNRNGFWEVRIMNKHGNYLDEFGNVADPNYTHGIFVESR